MSGRLTQQQRLQIGVQPIDQPQSVPSPFSGWNTRDALDAMAPTDAVILDNFYPDAGGVSLRNGYALYADGMGSAPVKTLAEYLSNTEDKFLAAASGHIYDITTGIPVSIGSGFSNDAWQTQNFLSRMFFCNGVNTVQVYDGSTLANSAFTGVTLSTLIGVSLYQQRLFFWQNDSTGFWYAPLNSISGALTFYDLSAFSPRGGNLLAMTRISHDGGNGVTDIAVFIMTSGDCLLFLGNDPSLSTNWGLIGIYQLSPPVSPRAVYGYGADAFLTTFDDHVPLQQELVALKLGQLPPRSKISNSVQAAVQANQTGFGWQALFYPAGRRLIFNIPNTDGTFDQHVMNTVGGPWCRFVNMNAYTWGIFDDGLYFGGANGSVYRADIGTTDLDGTIAGTGQTAWNTFGDPNRKAVKAVRSIVNSTGSLQYAFGVGFDYGDINVGIAPISPNLGSPWDTSPWDTSPWSPESEIDTRWRIGGGTGQSISFQIQVNAMQGVQWLRTDFRESPGNAL